MHVNKASSICSHKALLDLMAESGEKSEQSMAEKTPYHVVNGVLVPAFVTQELVDGMKEMTHYQDDVWIITYPKSGITWTSQIVKLIHSKGVQDNIKVTTTVPWLEAERFTGDVPLEDLPRPRAFRSHFPYDKFPCGPPHSLPSKFIYVMRNPKDLVVSHFNFVCLHGMLSNITWDQFWMKFINGTYIYGDTFDHVLSWWAHRDSPNILVLTYEDMKKDLPQAVSKIASFLQVDLSLEVVQKIADLTTFDKMKTDATANYSWEKLFDNKEGKPSFLRKGKVGDWKNHLTAEESAAIDKKYAEKCKGTDIVFNYD